jgi:hypothetical protein
MIQNLDGQEKGGRALRVNEAQDRPRGGGGGGRWLAGPLAYWLMNGTSLLFE